MLNPVKLKVQRKYWTKQKVYVVGVMRFDSLVGEERKEGKGVIGSNHSTDISNKTYKLT